MNLQEMKIEMKKIDDYLKDYVPCNDKFLKNFVKKAKARRQFLDDEIFKIEHPDLWVSYGNAIGEYLKHPIVMEEK